MTTFPDESNCKTCAFEMSGPLGCWLALHLGHFVMSCGDSLAPQWPGSCYSCSRLPPHKTTTKRSGSEQSLDTYLVNVPVVAITSGSSSQNPTTGRISRSWRPAQCAATNWPGKS